ncbi:MAG TPA: hypothetical protein VJT73_15615 [Polyangiaceae bacterium]|nr:hypothetical protein [Polyangiaceae bacterium]
MRILTGQRRDVILWGGTSLTVTSNNPSVVPNDGFQESASRSDGLRRLGLLGKKPGTAMLEAKMGGSIWCSLQVQVGDVDLTANPVTSTLKFDSPFNTGPGGKFPVSGSVPTAFGLPTVVRIPVPGTRNLAIEFFPRNYGGKSTSTLFIQDLTGKIHLRLDYGPNVATKTVDYHWNVGNKQKGGMQADFGIKDHAVAGKSGQALYKFAKYYRWGGRVLVVVGATFDVIEVVQSDHTLRTATQKVAAWAGAWAGCKVVGAFGAGVGTAVEPVLGTAIGGIVGCVIGGYAGYTAASETAGDVYDWSERTIFKPLPQMQGER